MNLFSRFMNDESGATAIEYGLIAAIVAVGIIAGLGTMKDELVKTLGKVETSLKGANAAAP
jgi:pilus assembly protein Flp/PilA